jgi:anti-anti-sigma factor
LATVGPAVQASAVFHILETGEPAVILRNELENGEVELDIRGPINSESVGEFRTALNTEIETDATTAILLNLERVPAIVSAAIGILVFAHKKAADRGKTLRISACNAHLLRTFLMIHLDRVIGMPGGSSAGTP